MSADKGAVSSGHTVESDGVLALDRSAGGAGVLS